MQTTETKWTIHYINEQGKDDQVYVPKSGVMDTSSELNSNGCLVTGFCKVECEVA